MSQFSLWDLNVNQTTMCTSPPSICSVPLKKGYKKVKGIIDQIIFCPAKKGYKKVKGDDVVTK